MKKLILISSLMVITLFACKKGEEPQPETNYSPMGTKWQLYEYFASTGERYHKYDFKSSTQVDYYVTTGGDNITSNGKSTLTYSIDNPKSSTMKLHVVGIVNGPNGTVANGTAVDFFLDYKINVADNNKPSLSKSGTVYKQFFF